MRTSVLVPSLLAALAAVGAGCSRTPPAPSADGTRSAATTKVDTAPAPTPATAIDPCTLLGVEQVRAVLADAQAGVRDRGDENLGVMLCSWSGADGRVGLELHDAPSGAAVREIQERSIALIDPKSPDATRAVRIEILAGVGDATLAFAEKVDAARGIRRDDAVVVLQKGFRVVTISAPTLAAGDRAAALLKLKDLATAAAAKL